MNEDQLYIYFLGFLAFIISCLIYLFTKIKNHSEKKNLILKKIMNFFLFISFILLIYSWF